MMDGVNDRISFVDNTLTMMTAVVRDRGVPHEEEGPFVGLKLIACVAKKDGLKILFPEHIKNNLHQTFTARCCRISFLILVSMDILTVTFKDLLSVHRNIVLLKTGEGRTIIRRPNKTKYFDEVTLLSADLRERAKRAA